MNSSPRMASATSLPKIDQTPAPQMFERWKQQVLQRTQLTLEQALPASIEPPARLHEAMRYAVLGSGKRMPEKLPQRVPKRWIGWVQLWK